MIVLRQGNIIQPTYDSTGNKITGITNPDNSLSSLGSPVYIIGNFTYGSTLTATLAPGWVVTGYQWTRDGVDISSATSSTYTLVAADIGKTISVKVTGLSFIGTDGKSVLYTGPDLLRYATPYNKIASGSISAASGEKRIAGRLFRPIGSSAKKSLQVVANNFYLSGTTAVTNPTNAITVIGVYLEYNNVSKQITWGGNGTPSFSGGTRNQISDKVYPSDFGLAQFSRDLSGYLRYELSCPNGGVLPVSEGRESVSLAFQYDASANSCTNLSSTGALQWTNGQPSSAFEPPLLIVGEDVTTSSDGRAWLFVGDSIVAQGGDNSYLHTATRGSGSSYISACSFAKVGAIINQALNNNSVLADFVKYANGVVDEYHTNSVAGSTLTDMQNACLSLWSNVRAAASAHPLARTLIVGRTALLNRTTDATGASVLTSDWNAGGKVEQLNDWFATKVGSGVEFYMANLMDSPTLVRRGSTTKGVLDSDYYKWPNAYTADGTHPNSTSASPTTGLGGNARVYLLANA